MLWLKRSCRAFHPSPWRIFGTVSRVTPLYPNNLIIFLHDYDKIPFIYFNTPPNLYLHYTSLDQSTVKFVELLVFPVTDRTPAEMDVLFVYKLIDPQMGPTFKKVK
jgi:hypothetical protein